MSRDFYSLNKKKILLISNMSFRHFNFLITSSKIQIASQILVTNKILNISLKVFTLTKYQILIEKVVLENTKMFIVKKYRKA